MRVLIVSQQVRHVRSGVGTYARILLERLPVRATVATWTHERDERYEVDWVDLGEPPRWDPTPGAFWSLGRRVARAAGQPFDLVHFLDAREAHAWRGGGRLIGTVHDDYAICSPRRPWGLVGAAADPLRRWAYYRWLSRLERTCYGGFDLLLANSSATATSLRELHGVNPACVRTIPLCVTEDCGATGAKESLAGGPALLFVGGNFYRKGLDVLVRSLQRVAATRPKVHLHVVGEDGARASIVALARRLGLLERITFHDRVPAERMPALFAGADQFVMASRREALGLVYLEAFRAGIPVIAGEKGGVVDIVSPGESGLLVPPGDPTALAEAILTLSADGELRARLAAGGRRVLAERTPDRLLAETLAAYEWSAREGSGLAPGAPERSSGRSPETGAASAREPQVRAQHS
ncbi:MAG: glycosyltransferase family 4 protein [Planctomycetota bacterium]